MSEQTHGGTGRWLRRITQSMSGEPRDLAQLIEGLREASERGLFDNDALTMLEGVLAVADMQVQMCIRDRAGAIEMAHGVAHIEQQSFELRAAKGGCRHGW